MKGLRPLFVISTTGVIALVLYVANTFLAHTPIKNFPPHGTHIVALGDSLTVGVGASEPQRGLIPVLEKRIGKDIVNSGISGDTTHDARTRLTRDVLEEHPHIVLVLLGGNDYLKKVSKKETFDNLRAIIGQIQSRGSVVLLLGIRGGLLADNFAEDFVLLAKETGSAFVPNVLDGVWGNPKLMSDEVHPNDLGYEKMVDKIAPVLLGLLASAPAATTPP